MSEVRSKHFIVITLCIFLLDFLPFPEHLFKPKKADYLKMKCVKEICFQTYIRMKAKQNVAVFNLCQIARLTACHARKGQTLHNIYLSSRRFAYTPARGWMFIQAVWRPREKAKQNVFLGLISSRPLLLFIQ